MHDRDLRDFLGYDLGVAITGGEQKGALGGEAAAAFVQKNAAGQGVGFAGLADREVVAESVPARGNNA